MRMTVRQLIEELEDCMDDDVEVRIAEQPHRPMEYGIKKVVLVEEDGKAVFYIVEGTQHGYISNDVCSWLGW